MAKSFIHRIIDHDIAAHQCTTVRTRFPPEPNGCLHIGHAQSICLNFGIARTYGGICYLRFDDTNPERAQRRYVEAIKDDIVWLGFQWHRRVRYTSQYFGVLYQYAKELIEKGLAYVDELSIEQTKRYRGTFFRVGQNSPYRNRSVEENLRLFSQMKKRRFSEGSKCLRAKIDMRSPFLVMRDPVLYRIKYTPHHRTKTRWCIYPTYDFAHCISDCIENITHSLCTLEFQDNRRLYNWILRNVSVRVRPRQYEFSRLNLEYTSTSKRNLRRLVEGDAVAGWNDPRMPTLSGLRRRGYPARAITTFCDRVGVTRQNHTIPIQFLEACVRSALNARAPRVMAVIDPVVLVIDDLPEHHCERITVPNHPTDPSMGRRTVVFHRVLYIDRSDVTEHPSISSRKLSLGRCVKLRYSHVVQAVRVVKDAHGTIAAIHCRRVSPSTAHPLRSRFNGIVHWVSARNNVPSCFRLYDRLFDVPDPDHRGDVCSHVNPESLTVRHGFVESNVSPRRASPYQFEREGYFAVDDCVHPRQTMVFNRVVTLRRGTLSTTERNASNDFPRDATAHRNKTRERPRVRTE